MRWFRANRRWGGRLALLALALQFVLAFAHVHAEDFAAPAHSSVAISTVADDPICPGHETSQDDCSICATIQMLRTAVNSATPLLTPPSFVTYEWSLSASTQALALHTSTLFHARAPPLA